MAKQAPKSARAVAMDYLARREHARAELERKLAQKDFSSDEILTALDGLAKDNLQSDERYVEHYVRAQVARGQGPLKISQILKQAGVSDSLIQSGLYGSEIDWSAVARIVWERKFGSPPADLADKAKQQRFMMQRGFTHDHIQSVYRFD